MKFTLTFKAPNAIDQLRGELPEPESEDEGAHAELLIGIDQVVERWVRYGEYLRVEFDTAGGTCVVLPAKG